LCAEFSFDRNHRTAYEVAKTFLMMNGGRMAATDLKGIIGFIKSVTSYDVDEIEAWLRYGEVTKRP
jgi:prophage maintenance system killer protein